MTTKPNGEPAAAAKPKEVHRPLTGAALLAHDAKIARARVASSSSTTTTAAAAATKANRSNGATWRDRIGRIL